MLRPKYSFVLLFLCCTVSLAIGQQGVPDRIGDNLDRGPSVPALKKQAEKSANRGDNNAAMHYYRLILRLDSLNADALEGFGEAAFAHTKYDSAAWAFQFLLDSFLTNDRGYMMARLADIQYCKGHYSLADSLYKEVTRLKDPSSRARGAAATGQKKCAWAQQFLDGQESVEITRLPDSVNLRHYAEYAPLLLNNTLYFTSYRFPLHGDSTDLLMGIMTAEPSGDSFLLRKSIFNVDDRHTAYATFNRDSSMVYYAIGKYAENKSVRFELYRRRRAGSNGWSDAERLPASINASGSTNTQPNLGVLPGEQNETLFFVSDRSDGTGGKDIWYSKLVNDTFSTPQNLGKLNTPEDDVSPFFHSASATLYFSSEGYPNSLGGFDIFRVKRNGNDWSDKAEPMPPPFNSGANDVFFSMTGNGIMRFFASNREGSLNNSEEGCCYDLYSTQRKPEIKIEVCHETTGAPLTGTDMRLLEKSDYGLKEISHVTVSGYTQTFPLLPDKYYAVVTSKAGFSADTFYFDTYAKVWDKNLEQKRCLKPLRVDLNVYVLDADTKKPVNGATVHFYDLSALLADGSVKTGPDHTALNFVAREHADSSSFHYDLDFQHQYLIAGSKAGYTSDTTTASTLGILHDTTLRRELLLTRGLSFSARVFDDITKAPLDSIHFQLVDLTENKSYQYSTGKDDNAYPDSVIYYNRRYRIIATKDNYTTDSLEFRTDRLDSVAFMRIYKELFLKSLLVEHYLPIVLYFDNDQPDSCTLAKTTEQLYVKTYTKYYARKAKYIDECRASIGSTEAMVMEMDTFFDNQVQREWLKLFAFQELLIKILESGKHVKITVQGFASPRGNGAYNQNLTSRRVKSVLNQLSKFEGENYFPPYIKSGQLELIEDPHGSADAPDNVPKKANDKRSIYSVGAAKERRAKIIGVSVEESAFLQLLPQK